MRFSKKKAVAVEHRCKWCNVQCVTVGDRVMHERSCAKSRDWPDTVVFLQNTVSPCPHHRIIRTWPKNRIMVSYWCCKKNSIIDNYLKPDHNSAWIPCIKEACPRWKEWEGRGGCILLVKEGKRGRPWTTRSGGSSPQGFCPSEHESLAIPWEPWEKGF